MPFEEKEFEFEAMVELDKCLRSALCGLIFAFPTCFLAPFSPMFRGAVMRNRSKTDSTFPAQLIGSTFGTTLVVATGAYFATEAPVPNGAHPVFPQLNPKRGVVVGLSVVAACHALFPGLIVLLWEVGAKRKFSEYARLTGKVSYAFMPAHTMAMTAVGGAVGGMLYPLRVREAAASAAAADAE